MESRKEPEFVITIVCNKCNALGTMYPRGDETDLYICQCGRRVRSYLRESHPVEKVEPPKNCS